MHINLDKFYSSNYRDFVHRQALEDALKLVAEIYLKDTKVDTILNITFSVDEYGENPIYLTYLDEEKKEHIVKLKPNITEALLERLKEYAKISYVDEQDEKLRQELTQVIDQSKQEAIETANNFTISHTNEVKNDILNIINQTIDDLKEYCDNKCEMTLLASKNYTDTKADEINQRIDEEHEYNRERYVIGTINRDGLDTGKRFTEIGVTPNQKKYAHFVNFIDARDPNLELNHAGGYLLNYDGYTNLVSNLSKAGIPIYLTTQDGTPLFVSEISFLASEFTNQDFISADLKDGVNDVRGFLINQENLEKLYSLDLSGYATKEELNSLDGKVDLVNQQVETNKSNIDYHWENIEQLKAGQEENKNAIAENSNRIDDANQLITDNDSKTNEELGKINDRLDNLPQSEDVRLTEIPKKGKASYINWYPDKNVNYIRLLDDGNYTRAHIAKPDGTEQITYLPNNKINGTDHTLTVVEENQDAITERDFEATAVRFQPLLISGDTDLPNSVLVETSRGQKRFNFLPDGIDKNWFDQINTVIKNLGSNVSVEYQDSPIEFYVSITQGSDTRVVSNDQPCTLHVTNVTVDNKIYRFYNTSCTVDTQSSFAEEIFNNNYQEYEIDINGKASNEIMELLYDLGTLSFPSMNVSVTASCLTGVGVTLSETTTGTYNFNSIFAKNRIKFNLPHGTNGNTNADIGVNNENIRISLNGIGRMETEAN